MKKYSLHLLTVMFILAGIASCKKEAALPEENTNQPPVACAGQDQTITLPVNSLMLD